MRLCHLRLQILDCRLPRMVFQCDLVALASSRSGSATGWKPVLQTCADMQMRVVTRAHHRPAFDMAKTAP